MDLCILLMRKSLQIMLISYRTTAGCLFFNGCAQPTLAFRHYMCYKTVVLAVGTPIMRYSQISHLNKVHLVPCSFILRTFSTLLSRNTKVQSSFHFLFFFHYINKNQKGWNQFLILSTRSLQLFPNVSSNQRSRR